MPILDPHHHILPQAASSSSSSLAHSHPPMAFTVAIGSVGGVAIIPCGNTIGTPCTLLPHLTSFPRTRRNFHVVWAKKFSPESPLGSVTTTDEEQQRTAEIEDPVDDAAVDSYEWLGIPGSEPDYWQGPQWDWLGTFVKYSWIIGFPVAVIVTLYGCATHRVIPKDLKQAAAMKGSESVESSELFEDPKTFDSDVFDSNPTEVAPSLE
ncbi:hypothetical protein VNO77_33064 [Canavalia gladiata]|uniref:Uncharacterized protein n=1 Tax=Canavalia gladiata TaxID=3824 RepID=A0AAN9Q063_CANGL